MFNRKKKDPLAYTYSYKPPTLHESRPARLKKLAVQVVIFVIILAFVYGVIQL